MIMTREARELAEALDVIEEELAAQAELIELDDQAVAALARSDAPYWATPLPDEVWTYRGKGNYDVSTVDGRYLRTEWRG